MAQAFSRQSLNAEIGVRSRVSLWQICGGQIGAGQIYPQVLQFRNVSVVSQVLTESYQKYKRERQT
jgi:hypothetical protein